MKIRPFNGYINGGVQITPVQDHASLFHTKIMGFFWVT